MVSRNKRSESQKVVVLVFIQVGLTNHSMQKLAREVAEPISLGLQPWRFTGFCQTPQKKVKGIFECFLNQIFHPINS